MKLNSSQAALLLMLLLSGHLVYGQDSLGPKPKKARSPDDYKPRTLEEVVGFEAGEESRGNKEETMLVHSNILPSRVRVTFTGTKRPLPEIKKEVLRQWARFYAGAPETYTRPYETEMLFSESGRQYWLAVRKEGLPRYEEMKSGDAAELYLIRVGAAKISAEWEPMLLIESFQKRN